jgi:hypothetical protein
VVSVSLQKELGDGVSQLLGHFNRMMRKFVHFFQSLEERRVAGEVGEAPRAGNWSKAPLAQSVDEELVTVLACVCVCVRACVRVFSLFLSAHVHSSLLQLTSFRISREGRGMRFWRMRLWPS